jgi:hypothetical protein
MFDSGNSGSPSEVTAAGPSVDFEGKKIFGNKQKGAFLGRACRLSGKRYMITDDGAALSYGTL